MTKRSNTGGSNFPQLNAGGRARRGDGEAKKAANLTRVDGWANVLTGQRTQNDYRNHTRFKGNRNLGVEELETMYRQDALTRRIIDDIPNLITRDPWTLEGDSANDIWQYLADRKMTQYYRRGLKWGRLYGGGVMIIGANDGGDLEEPLNMNRIRSIDFFRVYDRYCVTGSAADWSRDPNSARFGKREWYTIYPRGVVIPQASFRVHYSRVIQFDGVTTTDVQLAKNYGFDDSVMQVVFEDVRRFLTGIDDASALIRDFVQGVINIKGLASKIGNQQGEQQLKSRLDMMDLTRHILNTMVLDEGEAYTKVSSSVTGIADIIDRLMALVSVAAGEPQSILFGRAPQGMNATGEMDLRSWYDSCGSNQSETMGPNIQMLTQIVCVAKDYKGGFKGEDGVKPTVNFKPLWKPTDKETAELRLAVAQADQVYLTAQVVSPEEVAMSRFGGDSYSIETQLAEPRDPEAPDPKAEAEAAAQAAAALAAAKAGGTPSNSAIGTPGQPKGTPGQGRT